MSPSGTLDERPIFGSGLPGQIWQQYMNAVLNGTPEEDLPDEPMIDGDTGEGVPEPEPEPEPEPGGDPRAPHRRAARRLSRIEETT